MGNYKVLGVLGGVLTIGAIAYMATQDMPGVVLGLVLVGLAIGIKLIMLDR